MNDALSVSTYLSAYLAYRFGYRSHLVTTKTYMQKIFGKENERVASLEALELTFEDLFLNFPDRDTQDTARYSVLATRDQEFPGLRDVQQRVFVTVGHHRTLSSDERSNNRAYLQTRKENGGGGRYRFVYKPVSGIYNLKRDARLRPPDGFVWPPSRPRAPDSTSLRPSSHSAPGRLLVIAERLIQRAERILGSAMSVEDSIYGALLALEAQELLGNRTPTTALEALALRQQLEVIGECMFYGVEAHLNVKDRFREIEREVRSIGHWFNPHARKAAELNAQTGIVNKLTSRFREHNQFDEEQECLNKARQLERFLGLHDPNAGARLWALVAFPFRWYVERLLGSMRWFVLALVGWVALFVIAYCHCCNCLKKDGHTFRHGFADAISSFVGLQPPHELDSLLKSDWALWLSIAAIVLGFVHLGIFISHLYSMIARR